MVVIAVEETSTYFPCAGRRNSAKFGRCRPNLAQFRRMLASARRNFDNCCPLPRSLASIGRHLTKVGQPRPTLEQCLPNSVVSFVAILAQSSQVWSNSSGRPSVCQAHPKICLRFCVSSAECGVRLRAMAQASMSHRGGKARVVGALSRMCDPNGARPHRAVACARCRPRARR